MVLISELSIVIVSLILTSIALLFMISLYQKYRIRAHKLLAFSWFLVIGYIVLDFLPTVLLMDEKYSTSFTWLARIGTIIAYLASLILVYTYFIFQYQSKPTRWFFYLLLAGAASYTTLTNFNVEVVDNRWISVYHGELGVIIPGIFGIAICLENVNLATKSWLNLPESKSSLGILLILEAFFQLLFPIVTTLRDESIGILGISRSAPLILVSLMNIIFSYVIWKDKSVVTYNVTKVETIYITSKDGVSGYVSYNFKNEQLLSKMEELKQIGLFTDLLANFEQENNSNHQVNIWHQNKHIKILQGSIFRLILISERDNEILNDYAKYCLTEFNKRFEHIRIEDSLAQQTIEKMVNLIRETFQFADMVPRKEFKLNNNF
ncbi:MAG: hypothetical protein KAR35_05815 [Candidatus Heimdallarchaeota archaeon]|nr:hypothetical protein [Candidatus Heimdallarchaeota archaeon]MCK5048875.1 hypothetical protein [Candidatus Heimdallarchaeota archaeon]